MLWKTWKPVFALGAVLAAAGTASAGDREPTQTSGGATVSTTMTLGGKGTAAQAATEDSELTGGYRGGYGYGGGYRGWGGGYGGYRGGYYGGYRGAYYGGYRGGYYGGYRPAYYGGYYRPYYSNYYRPYYGVGVGVGFYSSYYSYPTYSIVTPTCDSDSGVYLGIGGAGSGAPSVPLGTTNFARPMAQPTAPNGDGTFPYDGGPVNPVPVPMPDAKPSAVNPTTTDLPISLKPKPVVTNYKYKAYGEK